MYVVITTVCHGVNPLEKRVAMANYIEALAHDTQTIITTRGHNTSNYSSNKVNRINV